MQHASLHDLFTDRLRQMYILYSFLPRKTGMNLSHCSFFNEMSHKSAFFFKTNPILHRCQTRKHTSRKICVPTPSYSRNPYHDTAAGSKRIPYKAEIPFREQVNFSPHPFTFPFMLSHDNKGAGRENSCSVFPARTHMICCHPMPEPTRTTEGKDPVTYVSPQPSHNPPQHHQP